MLTRSWLHKGFTLVELMIVVAIISVVAALSISAIRKNAAHDALTSLSNETVSAFTTQRTRALTTGRAAYVFVNTANGGTIDLYMGTDSHCSANEGARVDIVYADDAPASTVRMGIDLASGGSTHRTLNSPNQDSYYNNGKPKMRITAAFQSITVANNVISTGTQSSAGGNVGICFQPNGQTVFLLGNARNTAANSVIFTIEKNDTDHSDIGGVSQVRVEQFGNIRAQFVPYQD